MNYNDFFSNHVAYDRNNHQVNTMILNDCHLIWNLGLKGNKVYVNELCYSDKDLKNGKVAEYIKMFDNIIIVACYDGKKAFELAKTIQTKIDAGMSVEEIIAKIKPNT